MVRSITPEGLSEAVDRVTAHVEADPSRYWLAGLPNTPEATKSDIVVAAEEDLPIHPDLTNEGES